MADELLAILTGKPAAAPAQGAPGGIDPNIDLAVRTIIGEGANQDATGRQAIAAVIANRAKATNRGFGEIVNEPGQFSAWGDPKLKARMESVKTSDPLYQSILADVTPALQGKVDPTNGADHYYAPKTIGPPAWAVGAGQDIGDHRFYKLGYGAQGGDDLAGILGVAPDKAAPDATGANATPEQEARIKELTDPSGGKPQAAPADKTNVAVGKDGKAFFRDTGESLNDAQHATVLTLWKGGQYDPEKGLINGRPIVAIKASTDPNTAPDYPTQPGTFFIDPEGHLGMVPMDDKGLAIARGGKGALRGLIDVGQSLGQMMPGTKNSDVLQTAKGNRLVYEAQNKGDLAAGIGRFTGQAIPTTIAIAGGGELLAPLRAAAGPVGEFLAGKAGGNLLMRGGSLAASGAIEGGAAGALTSASNDESLATNIRHGMEAGAVLKPLVAGGAGAIKNAIVGKAAGAIPAADQAAILDQAQSLPVPVNLTRGMVTEAPGQTMSENLLLKGAKGDQAAQLMRDAASERQGAIRGNVEAIENKLTGQAPLQTGEGGAKVSEALNAARDAADKRIGAAYDTARSASDGGYLPAAERPKVAQRLREAVKDYDPEEIGPVTRVLDAFDGSPSSSTLTPTDLFEARAKLTKLRGTNDPYKGGAAAQAVRALDSYIDDAVKADLISGDPKVVKAWKDAIGERRAFGKLFEGKDLIEDLTARGVHGEGVTLKVAPEDASNLIFGRSGLGAVGRKNLSRDLTRLKTTLGPDSEAWNALRGEAFKRLAREGEGAPEAGQPQFSGQKFLKAWNKLETDNPQVVDTLFGPDERKLITDFAQIAQRATTSVKGGDNPSNSGVLVVKKVLENLWTAIGGSVGALGGGVLGPGGSAGGAGIGATIGKGLDSVMKDMGAVVEAQKALRPKVITPPKPLPKYVNRLLGAAPGAVAGIEGNKLLEASP